jgi:hypothetical protein
MGNYANIQNEVRRTIYQNSGGAITGATLQELLLSVINVLGNESCFKVVLSNGNKPSAAVDGKQWYVGYSANGTTTVNLTAVGLGTLSITPTDLYIVYSTVSGWAAVNIGAGLGAAVTGISNAMQHIYAAQKDCVRIMVDASDDGEYTVINDVTNVKFMAVDGVPIEVTDKPELSAGGHSVDFIFEDTSLFMSNSIIPERCFQGISILKSVIIPSYILAIGDSAFEGSAVSSVYCFGTEPPALGDSVFADTGVFVGGEFSEVYVPSGTEAVYINAWGSGTYQELSII